jgi:hypothetical protein
MDAQPEFPAKEFAYAITPSGKKTCILKYIKMHAILVPLNILFIKESILYALIITF